MKRLILFIGAALAISIGASAQVYAPVAVTVPDTMTASSTSNLTSLIDVRRNTTVALQMVATGADASTGNITYTFAPSIDGVNFATSTGSRITWVVAANGTSQVVNTTNLTVNGFGYLRLVSVQNAATNGLTGHSLTYSIKNPAAQ